MLGDAMLVAPITSPGAGPAKVAGQVVWLPKGTWYNWFTGEKFDGGRDAVVAADLNEFPLFVKGGVPVPLQNYTERMASTPLNELIIRCYPGEHGQKKSFTLYEDDGITHSYENGEFAQTELQCSRERNYVTVTIGPATGKYKGQPQSRSYVIEFPCTIRSDSASVNGKSVRVEYDETNFTNRIHIPKYSITKKIRVEISLTEIDPGIAKQRALHRRLAGIDEAGKGRETLERTIQKYSGRREIESLLALAGIALQNKGFYDVRKKEDIFLYYCSQLADNGKITVKIVDRNASHEQVLFIRNHTLDTGQVVPLATSKDRFDKPALGTRASRSIDMEFKVGGKNVKFSKPILTSESCLEKWNIIGPFDFDAKKSIADTKHGPEIEPVDLSASFTNGLKWQRVQCDDLGIVNLRKCYDAEYKIAYAVTGIKSPKDQKVIFKINTDDGVEVWLNGKKIFSKDAARCISHEPDVVPGFFKRGDNVLLMKISQYSGEWGFKVALECPIVVEEIVPRSQGTVASSRAK
jgi:hypothetical protein